MPDAATFPRGMLERLDAHSNFQTPQNCTRQTASRAQSAQSEVVPPQAPAKEALGLVNKCLPGSKPIRKPDSKAYMAKLCDKYPQVFDEIQDCRRGLAKLKAKKLAYQERIKAIMSGSLITEMMDSAADDSQTHSEEE